jgi:serine/threonine protein kinase
MAEAACCPKCGMNLAPNAPRGLCPGCLFKGALEVQASMTGAGHSADRFRDAPPTPQELASCFPELEILQFVGRGGMGMVYQARQKQLDRIVALKILSPIIARDPAFAERFAREARVMALLTHPHIVTVYDFGTTSLTGTGDRDVPLFYFLMEFVDGLTLRQLLDAGQLAPPQAFAIVPQICEALQYAHDKGVVHRDIKPENILVDRQGNVKIADFGLAKLMGVQAHDVTISTTGQVLGTLHYMAPEQMERPLEVDHRADIYSLGVVFYQMLTGELPLGRFAPPSQKVLVDARLDEVVLRALEKEPGRRYQQASALGSRVETIATTPFTTPGDLCSSRSRKSWLAALAGRSRVVRVAIPTTLFCVLAGYLIFYGPLHRNTGNMSNAALANAPHELKQVSTARVIETGIEMPLSPWAWQELERRTITASDVDTIIEGLTAWLRREHPGGMSNPLPWLDQFLQQLDGRGLVTEQRKISFLEALHGDLRGERIVRLREGTRRLSPNLEWRWNWTRDLFGMTLMNELQTATIDGQPLSLTGISPTWDWPTFYHALELPPLPAGKHMLRLSALSALVLTADLVGLKKDARSADWPSARKRWTRTIDMEVSVFPDDAEIISTTQDPALDPASHGLSVEPIIVRGAEGHKNATLKFTVDQSLAVPIGFDVSLRIAGQTIPCGSLWAVKTQNRTAGSDTVLSAEIPQIGGEVKEADVVLTPNPKLIELRPDVDRFWGHDVVFRKVTLRRLDLAEPNSSDPTKAP